MTWRSTPPASCASGTARSSATCATPPSEPEVLLENLLMALKAIWANKMRSMLTTLGIVIGTAAVIAVVSIVQGFSQVITQEVQNLGANTIIVEPFRPPGKEGDKLGKIVLTWDDGLAVMRTCPSVTVATPVVVPREHDL